MCLVQGPKRSDAGEARTHDPSVSSQALYHQATALPFILVWIFFILAYNKDNHKFLDEFEFQVDQPQIVELTALERHKNLYRLTMGDLL